MLGQGIRIMNLLLRVERIVLHCFYWYPFRDEKWLERVKEEYMALIKLVELNKSQDNDWFKIESDKEGKK